MESIATAKVIKPRKKFTRLRTTKNAESAMDFCWEKYLWDMLAVVARFSTRSAILGNNIKYYNHHQIYRVSQKKTPLKEMCDFLTLKMLPLALALIKTKNCHLFDPLVKN